jgi:hypothetical protein
MDQFQAFLSERFGDSIENAYIQPPAGMQMSYPCLTIERDRGETSFADNQVWRHQKRYLVTAISEDPDSLLYDQLAALPRSHHERSFSADNLTHDVFTIFFEEETE